MTLGDKTRVQITTHGKDAYGLLAEIDRLFLDHYGAKKTAAGQYEMERRFNFFSLNVLLEELLQIVMNYGPDTYYSNVHIKGPDLFFQCRNMGEATA